MPVDRKSDSLEYAETGTPVSGKHRIPEPGQQIGRFTVLEVLGKGGMGIVVAAHDPELQRRVAIKLVRAGGKGTGERVENQSRLVREAQAMAQLRHANVVSVYEAGTHEGQVYVAMDLIPGGTLRGEIQRMRRAGEADWREVLRLFTGAARGLAAAHERGLIHRDFKPDNVFIDGDDVVVGDFGLVAASGSSSTPTPASGPITERLTRADEVIGTPAYMAPEQYVGAALDERTDQFAFCVSLYEALYGETPFAAENRAAHYDAMAAGRLRPAPAGTQVPPWLRDVVCRGLSADPAERFPSMEALIDEFDVHGLRPTWRLRIVGGFITLMALLGITFAPDLAPAGAGYAAGCLANGAALLVVVLTAWMFRQTTLRTSQNRRVFGVFILAVAPGLLLFLGGSLMELELSHLRATLPLIWGIVGFAVGIFVDYRGWIVGPVYSVAFVAGALRPDLAPAIAAIAHGVMYLCLVLLRRDIVRG